jgi:hypothetical protein
VKGSADELPMKPFEVALIYSFFFLFGCGVGMLGFAGFPWQPLLASVPLFLLGGGSLSQALRADARNSFYHQAKQIR